MIDKRVFWRPLAILGALALSLPGSAVAHATEGATDTPVILNAPTTISAGQLRATVSHEFPQVTGYTFAGNPVGGRAETLHQVTIDGNQYTVDTVEAQRVSDQKVAYTVTFVGSEITMKAEIEVQEITSRSQGTEGAKRPTLTFRITEMSGAHTVEIPGHGLVSVNADQGGAYACGITGVSRGAANGDSYAGVDDTFASITASTPIDYYEQPSAYLMVNTNKVAVGMETNATYDQPHGYENNWNSRWKRQVIEQNGIKTLIAQNGQWTYRSEAATDAIGDEERPYTTLVFTGDANSSGGVDWQDAAVAYADITPEITGAADNHKWVVTHIPFDFGSAATHPFLQIADDVKRVSLATDGLGQRVMVKGYASEGHDSGHMDYGGNINTRAGGEADFGTLFASTKDVNAIYGVHVNTTEAYPEANSFRSLPFTGGRGWNWLNQSYYVNQRDDLGNGGAVNRFQELRNQFPLSKYPNFRWIYIDVYYGSGWQADRLGNELNKMGWEVGSEWADRFERHSLWSHWSNDEHYGGATNKGLNSQVIRFVDNANKDNWNPNVVLGYPQIVEFEGWTGHQDQDAFYRNIWSNNLPSKFLQNSRIMRYDTADAGDGKTKHTYTFANGTVASGATAVTAQTEASYVVGTIQADMSSSREFVYDGATVLRGDSYLLPWKDNGTSAGADRLYYYNPAGTATEWTLTKSYQGVGSLALYRLTDQGRVKVTDLAVSGGKVTIPASVYDGVAESDRDHTAFVLVPENAPAAVSTPAWGAGTVFADPGFNSGSLSGYTTAGSVSVVKDPHGDPVAQLGAGKASLSQEMTLNAGTYQGSAWLQINNGKTRKVTISASGDGVTSAGSQQRNGDLGATRDKPVTTVFEDFENIAEGWGPFVKGDAGNITDPRTVLASLNAPYTQRGGVLPDRSRKATDDAIAGHWSLKSHEENGGLVYRTVPQTVNLQAGHRYRISYDYDNAVSGSYYWVTAYDSAGADGVSANYLDSTLLPQTERPSHFVEELNVGACGSYWVGLYNVQGGKSGNDFSIDNFRVEDLGTTADVPACAAASIATQGSAIEGKTVQVTTTLVNNESADITNVRSELSLPAGWSAQATSPTTAETLAKGETFTTTWTVNIPEGAGGNAVTLTHQAHYRIGDEDRTAVGTTSVTALGSIKSNAVNYLSDIPFSSTSNSNGWGPVERDSEVGEDQAGDGDPISMNDQPYAKGLGAHAPSDLGFELDGKCTTFKATVGVQDGQWSGSVTFHVIGSADGSNWSDVVPETSVIRGGSEPRDISGNVRGMKYIRLIVGDGGNGNGNDHANWGNARVLCGNATEGGDTPAPDPTPTLTLKDYTGALQLVSAPAAYEGNPASNMFDKDLTTFYDKDWVNLTDHPSTIDLALFEGSDPTGAQPVSIGGLSIAGRAGQANGRPKAYEVYVGQDAANINQKVAEGTLRNTALAQRITFDEAVNAKYVRIRVLSNYKTKADQPDGLLAIAELGVLVPDGTTRAAVSGSDRSDGTRSARRARSLDDEQTLTVNTNAEGLVGQNYLDVQTVNDTDPAANPETVIDRTWAENWMAADQKHRTNSDPSSFQRVPVTFTVAKDGTKVRFTIAADEGDAPVLFDNLRMVKIERPTTNDLLGVDCMADPTPEACTTMRANARIGLSTALSVSLPVPTPNPTPDPTTDPTPDPTTDPSTQPTTDPTTQPSGDPSTQPSADPSQSGAQQAGSASAEQAGTASAKDGKKKSTRKGKKSSLARTGGETSTILISAALLTAAGYALRRRRMN